MRPAASAGRAFVLGIALVSFAWPAPAQVVSQSWPSPRSASSPDSGLEPMVEPYQGGRSQPAARPRLQPAYPSGSYQQPAQPSTGLDPNRPVTAPAPTRSPNQPAAAPPATRSPNQPVVSPGLRRQQPAAPPNQPVTTPTPSQPPSPGGIRRAPSVVAPDWPIRRPLNPVIVRPPDDDRWRRDDDRRRYDDDRWRHGDRRYYDDDRWRGDRRYDHRYRRRPLLYLPLVFFSGVVVSDYYGTYYRWRDHLSWEDSVTLEGEEDWVEFTLDSRQVGRELWIEIRDGRAQIDWTEIVFDDGTGQVVDFNERSFGPGLYRLSDFRYDRGVDYVRMVARATTNRVWIILRLVR